MPYLFGCALLILAIATVGAYSPSTCSRSTRTTSVAPSVAPPSAGETASVEVSSAETTKRGYHSFFQGVLTSAARATVAAVAKPSVSYANTAAQEVIFIDALSNIKWCSIAQRFTAFFSFNNSCAAMRCDALRCAAMRCDALRCAAMRCDALRCAAMRCDALRSGAMRCDALRCAAMRCDALRCAAMRCDALRCAAWRCVALRGAASCSIAQHCAALRSIAQNCVLETALQSVAHRRRVTCRSIAFVAQRCAALSCTAFTA
jgi:hypothetical protein